MYDFLDKIVLTAQNGWGERMDIEWNGSATFTVLVNRSEVDCFTVYGVETKEQAQQEALEWLNEMNC